MKERRIKIIVAVMAFSVIGLIALQIYWLKSIIKIEEERFDGTINIALLKTSEIIAKEEAADVVVKKITGGKKDVIVVVEKDSTGKREKIRNHEPLRIMRFDSSSTGAFGYRVTYSEDSTDKKRIEVFENRFSNIKPHQQKFEWEIDSNTVLLKHDQLVHNVVTELVSKNTGKKIEERISLKKIDSLLSRELTNAGINTEYFFAVNKLGVDSFTLIKNGTDPEQIKKSNFRTLLFPGEMFFDPNQLIVYFPNKNFFIFSSVVGMLGLSIVLIIVIAGVFFKTVQMFIRQKKITEIKNDLINNITHEFKTPISTISIACEALNEPGLTGAAGSVEKYSGIIKEENERLRMMVENLLTTAAFESNDSMKTNNSYHLVKENISLDELINSAVVKFEEPLRQKNGKILLEGIPSGIFINADKFHMANIIGNLIDNAVKYNDGEPKIVVALKQENGNVMIEISDNGIGIAKENIDKIFDTFFRVSKGNIQNVRGNGIGLSYAKKILEAHGENISVKSSPGKGSTFQIKFHVSSHDISKANKNVNAV